MPHKRTVSNPLEKAPNAQITIHGFLVTHELLNVTTTPYERHGGGKRSKVTEFSKDSRWRLLKTLAVIDWGRTRLITLTYPDWIGQDVLEKNQNHLRAFVERWVRHYGYRPSFVWRKEYTKAGVVHYHLLQPKARWHDDLISFVSRSWAEVLATERTEDIEKSGTKIEFARTNKKAMSYVSKYIAKATDPFPDYHRGRVWGWVGRSHVQEAKKQIYPIDTAIFFEEKDKLEKRIKHHVFAKRLQKLLKWW